PNSNTNTSRPGPAKVPRSVTWRAGTLSLRPTAYLALTAGTGRRLHLGACGPSDRADNRPRSTAPRCASPSGQAANWSGAKELALGLRALHLPRPPTRWRSRRQRQTPPNVRSRLLATRLDWRSMTRTNQASRAQL